MSDANQPVHMINGKLVPASQLTISARDLGVLRGYGVFDYLITYQAGRPFRLDDHVRRLFQSARLIDLPLRATAAEVTQWVHDTLSANGPGRWQIRIVATGGTSLDAITPSEHDGTLLIMVDPHLPLPDRCYAEGVGVVTARHRRYCPEAKTINYIEGVRGVSRARLQGGIEVVFHDEQVFEGSTSNIFALVDGRLHTPRSHILSGITRKTILDHISLAEPVEVTDFPLGNLLSAREVFLTASNKEICPVTRIDGRLVADGRVGAVTQEVMDQFRAFVEAGDW